MSQPTEDDDYEVSDSEGEGEGEVGEMNEDYSPSPKKVPSAKERVSDEEDNDEGESDVESGDEGEEDDDDEDYDDDDEEHDENTMFKSKTGPGTGTMGTGTGSVFNTLDDMSGDDEDDDDENYLQKFDQATQQKIIADYHPELLAQNYDEIDVLARVVRDENGNIIDPLHKTVPFLTRYEKARVLGERAKQLNAGGKPFIEVEPTLIDGYLIALKELEAKKIPFIIKRPMPNSGCEFWRLEDLDILA